MADNIPTSSYINVLSYLSHKELFYTKIVKYKGSFFSVFFLIFIFLYFYDYEQKNFWLGVFFLYSLLLFSQFFFEHIFNIWNQKKHTPLKIKIYKFNPFLQATDQQCHIPLKKQKKFKLDFFIPTELYDKFYTDVIENERILDYAKNYTRKTIQEFFFHFDLISMTYENKQRYYTYLSRLILYFIIVGFIILMNIYIIHICLHIKELPKLYELFFKYNSYILFSVWLYYTYVSLIRLTKEIINITNYPNSYQSSIVYSNIPIYQSENNSYKTFTTQLEYILTLIAAVAYMTYLTSLGILLS